MPANTKRKREQIDDAGEEASTAKKAKPNGATTTKAAKPKAVPKPNKAPAPPRPKKV
ncbi:hypothetical protein LTS18_011524, partial [Coniosporium uncinatum]